MNTIKKQISMCLLMVCAYGIKAPTPRAQRTRVTPLEVNPLANSRRRSAGGKVVPQAVATPHSPRSRATNLDDDANSSGAISSGDTASTGSGRSQDHESGVDLKSERIPDNGPEDDTKSTSRSSVSHDSTATATSVDESIITAEHDAALPAAAPSAPATVGWGTRFLAKLGNKNAKDKVAAAATVTAPASAAPVPAADAASLATTGTAPAPSGTLAPSTAQKWKPRASTVAKFAAGAGGLAALGMATATMMDQQNLPTEDDLNDLKEELNKKADKPINE